MGQRFEFLDEAAASGFVDAAAVAGGVGQVGEHVGRLQHDLQDVLGRLELVGANAVERRLENVGKGDEIVETERACSTLDGMNGTKDGIDGFRIAVAVIQFQKTGFQFGELFLAFLEEDLFDFVHIHRRKSCVKRLHARWHRSAWPGRTA